jgi:hypothetical protein
MILVETEPERWEQEERRTQQRDDLPVENDPNLSILHVLGMIYLLSYDKNQVERQALMNRASLPLY